VKYGSEGVRERPVPSVRKIVSAVRDIVGWTVPQALAPDPRAGRPRGDQEVVAQTWHGRQL
jgi:hypothetical protein